MYKTARSKSALNADPALRVSGVYLIVCVLWILFSDRLLLQLTLDVNQLTRLQTAKGWFFVIATAALLFVLIRRSTRTQQKFLEASAQAHEEVSRQKELLQRLIDNLPVMIAFVEGGQITFVNRALEKTLGWTLEELRNQDAFSEMYPDPACRQRVIDFIEAAEGRWDDFQVRLRDGRTLETAWADIRLSDGSIIGIGQDISERKEAEEALQESQERLSLALKAARLGVWTWELPAGAIHWDDETCRLFGLPPGNVPSDYESYLQLIHPEDRSRVIGDIAVSMQQQAPYEGRYRVVWPDGSVHFIASRGKFHQKPGEAQRLIGVSWDVTEKEVAERQLREKEERLNFLAYHDVLTRLPNRLLLEDRMDHAMAKARRTGGEVALIFLDLDRFKTINDSLGHAVGDRVLKEISYRLARQVRESDTVARLGGDEFVVVLEEVHDLEKVAAVAQKFIHELAREISVEGQRLYVTASAGISLFPEDGVDAEGLLKSAEAAMYRAKARGKNTWQYFTPDMNAHAQELLRLESGLREALEGNQFVLHYQPQIDLATGSLIGVEALVRWEHPERGTIPPAEFIPLAEETGLIVPLGEWVLCTACAQSMAWRGQGFGPVRMAVNISPRQFRQVDLVARVAAILGETGLEPDALELEVTEGMIMNDLEAAIATMEQLGRMGVHLAIDDFGTGYSSLSYLKRFPIAGLKIDRSFVRDVTTDPSDAQIAASIIALAHSMNLRVVAEGIETEGQLSFLKSHGCDEGQGYLFSPPCPPAELARRFRLPPSPP